MSTQLPSPRYVSPSANLPTQLPSPRYVSPSAMKLSTKLLSPRYVSPSAMKLSSQLPSVMELSTPLSLYLFPIINNVTGKVKHFYPKII